MKQAKAMKHTTALSALAGLMGLTGLISLPAMVQAQSSPSYFPAPGQWQHKTPEELGFDAAKLRTAIEFAQAHDSGWDFAKDQQRVFGTPLGPVPAHRAATNGVIVRSGYIVAEFGDTKANDP